MVARSISCSYWTYKSSYVTGGPLVVVGQVSFTGSIFLSLEEYPNNWVVRVDPAMTIGFTRSPKRPTFKGRDILEPELLEAIELW